MVPTIIIMSECGAEPWLPWIALGYCLSEREFHPGVVGSCFPNGCLQSDPAGGLCWWCNPIRAGIALLFLAWDFSMQLGEDVSCNTKLLLKRTVWG